MHDHDNSYFFYNDRYLSPTVEPEPSRITGVGRMRCRGSHWKDKQPDLKKHKHRKMAKKSKRANRR